MARSSYIYVLEVSGSAMAAWTVKYEAQWFIKNMLTEAETTVSTVRQFRDGRPIPIKHWSVKEFLA